VYKLIVLTDPDNADGFRLGGCDVRVAESPDEARRTLAELVDDDVSGIIALNAAFAAAIDERLQKKIDSTYRPIVVSLPITEKLEVGQDHRAYLSRLIRRAIGFDITLRRG
jgi:V/A-type H+-transporting ATPase subunit F